jgi:RNA polymerase sigma factor (sigma-70 family)
VRFTSRWFRGYNPMVGRSLNLPPPFEDAVRDHERGLLRVVLRMVGDRDDALDLFQEVWLRAYKAYPRLDSAEGLRPWLYRIATNLCKNHIRNRSRRSRVLVSDDGDAIASASVDDSPALRSRMQALVDRLPRKQREALLMRRIGGLDYGEIATALGCSPESARAHVSIATKKLRAQWNGAPFSASDPERAAD